MGDALATAAVLALVAGPVALALGLLNRRDRREAALWTALGPVLRMLRACPELRGAVAVGARVSLWRRALLSLDLRSCPPHRAGAVIEGIARHAPPGTTLDVRLAEARAGGISFPAVPCSGWVSGAGI